MSLHSLVEKTGTVMDVYKHIDAQSTIGGNQRRDDKILTNHPCRIRILSGRERDDLSGKEGVFATHRVYCVWNAQTSAITTNHHLRIDGKTYDIVLVNDVHRLNRNLQLDVEERG